MQDTSNNTVTRKAWHKPELVTYGHIEDLTGQTVKTLGFSDGVIFDPNLNDDIPGVPIGQAGS